MIFKEGYDRNRYCDGAQSKIYIDKIDTEYLAKFFNTATRNVLRWIKQKRFNPRDISSIVKYKIDKENK